MARIFVSDEMWEKIKPLLPPERGRKCRPSKDNRLIFTAMAWKIRTGAPWRDVPEEFGPWETVYTRFYRWSRSGLFDTIFDLVKEADTEWIMIDSTTVRAHQHAAGAKGGSTFKT